MKTLESYQSLFEKIFNSILSEKIWFSIVVIVVVRKDCSDQLSREQVISVIYSSPLRVNAPVSDCPCTIL